MSEQETHGGKANAVSWSGTNDQWSRRARKVLVGGVDSPVRSFQAVGGTPPTIVGGEGPWLFDVEGHRYLDLVQSYGAVLLGHGHPSVTKAVSQAAVAGTSFGAPTPRETLLAEAVCERVAGCEQVRFVSSGTEATMTALRLARGHTGRGRVVMFDGCYHGHSDMLLATGGSGVASLGLPGSAGVPEGAVRDTVIGPYNEVPELDGDVAGVIVEPVAANMGLVAPKVGFLEGLREACDKVGALLIFDEVITGFRVGQGGASTRFGIQPDLWCFGKVLGGGLPLAALGGPRQILSSLAPEGPVYQAGTLSGNPLATAAGLAVLSTVGPDDYAELCHRVAWFAERLEKAVTEGGLQARAPVVGPLLGLLLSAPDRPIGSVTNRDDVKAVVATGVYPSFFHALLRRGVALAPGPYEILFPGLAHTEQVLQSAVDAAGEASAEALAKLAQRT